MEDADVFSEQSGDLFQTHEAWSAWKRKFETLQSESLEGAAAEVFARHSALIDDLRQLVRQISDQAGLSFTDQRNSFYLVKLVVENILRMTDQIGILRGLGSGVAVAGSMTVQQHSRLTDLRQNAKNELQMAFRTIESVTEQGDDLALRVETGLTDFKGKFYQFVTLLESSILSAESGFSRDDSSTLMTLMDSSDDADSDQVFQQGTIAIKSAFSLFDLLLLEVDRELASNMDLLRAIGQLCFWFYQVCRR